MMKHLLRFLILFVLLVLSANAQLASGTIQTYGDSCTPSNCVTADIPFTSILLSVEVKNAFSGNIVVEESTDHSQTWTTVNTITTQVTSSYVLTVVPSGAPAITNFRLRANAWSSGQAFVKISSFGPATPVSGSVVAVQPVGSQLHMSCDTGCFPAVQPVSGTFWPSVQPVSGTFWQATQPVSLLSVPTHPVTQSGAWTVTAVQPAGASLHANIDQIAGANPCVNPTATLQSFTGTTVSATLTQVVGASGGTKIYICSLLVLSPSGAPTIQFQSGTGANCATGTAAVTPSVKLASGASVAFPSPVAVVPSGAALCYLAPGVAAQYQGTFVQQ